MTWLEVHVSLLFKVMYPTLVRYNQHVLLFILPAFLRELLLVAGWSGCEANFLLLCTTPSVVWYGVGRGGDCFYDTKIIAKWKKVRYLKCAVGWIGLRFLFLIAGAQALLSATFWDRSVKSFLLGTLIVEPELDRIVNVLTDFLGIIFGLKNLQASWSGFGLCRKFWSGSLGSGGSLINLPPGSGSINSELRIRIQILTFIKDLKI
jgi:hypothetical protein